MVVPTCSTSAEMFSGAGEAITKMAMAAISEAATAEAMANTPR